MYLQVEKPKENKSRMIANSVTQKKSNGKQGFGFVDNRPKSIVQRALQNLLSTEGHDIQQTESDFPIQRVLSISFTPSGPSAGSDVDRPNFFAAIDHMRADAAYLFPGEPIHMAHRLSWQSIRDTILTHDKTKIEGMIKNLTIPQRNFGIPGKGGVPAGDTSYYDAVDNLLKKYHVDSPQVFKALNSSPFNLRPGHGPTNSSIGGRPDGHFDETKKGEPMTPQSASLLPHSTTESSDFMEMPAFAIWESDFIPDYLNKAVASVKLM